MAKEANLNEIVQTLQAAQQNKELLDALTTSLERYVDQQQKELEELKNFISQAKEGKLKVKKKRRLPRPEKQSGGRGEQ